MSEFKELEKIHEQQTNNFINLFHESKTLLTLSFKELKQKIATLLNSIQKQQKAITNISIAVSVLKMGKHREAGHVDQLWLSNVEKNCRSCHLTPWETEVAGLVFRAC